MKKFNLSLVAVLAMSTFAMAGGDIKDVEPAIEPVVEVADDSAFYLGGGYGYMNAQADDIIAVGIDSIEVDLHTVMFQAGYQFNKYIAVEGRYWYGVSDATQTTKGPNVSFDVDYSGDYTAWGVYAKPMYPLGAVSLYALIGYSSTTLESDDAQGTYWDTDGFSFGLGAQYAINDNLSVFADYVEMADSDTLHMDDTNTDIIADISLYTINIGLNYKF